MRWFRLLFGNTSYAASATLCAYFLGLAIGAVWFGRAAGRSARPMRLYAGIELGIAAAALLVPLALLGYDALYPALYVAFGSSPASFAVVKLALALAAMLPCAIGIGGALPPLATAFLGREGDLGRGGAALYAANLLGGVIGAAAGGLLLPEWLGVGGTYALGMACSLLVAALAWRESRSRAPQPPRTAEHPPSPPDSAPAAALWIAGVSGFGLLAFEVLLVHALGRFFSHSAYSFGLVLVAVLLCLAIGAALVSVLSARFPVRPLLRGALLVEAGLLLLLPWAVVELRAALGAPGGGAASLDSPLARGALAVGALGVPALAVAALVFPLTFRLASGGAAGPRLGGLLAVNTLGGIAGSLAASFLLLEALGLWGSFAALGLAYAAAVPLLAEGVRPRALATAAALAVGVALLPVSPWRLPVHRLADNERVLGHAEGAFGLVAALEAGSDRLIVVDEHYRFGDTSMTGLYERSARLPLLLHPDPKRVAVIGSATGGLAGSVVEHDVEEIVLVEMVPEVHTLAATFFAEHNRAVHRDPRTRLVTEDGRNHLRATRDRYDVVVEDLFVPHRPSASAMYSRDHYLDVRAHLTGQGVYCQWLPIYQLSRTQLSIIVATFREVFPEATLWTPSFRPLPILGLVGLAGPAPSVEELARRGRERAAQGIDAPWLYDPFGLWTFYRGPAAGLEALSPAPASHSDAHPIFEFVSARTSGAVQLRFSSRWPDLVERLVASIPAADPVFPGHPAEAPRAGVALTAANRQSVGGRPGELEQAWRRALALLPERLLAPERREYSLSMTWPDDPRGASAARAREDADLSLVPDP